MLLMNDNASSPSQTKTPAPFSPNNASLEDLLQSCKNTLELLPSNQKQLKTDLTSISFQFERELHTLRQSFEQVERLRDYLNQKVETVEQMELENLEAHLVLDHRERCNQDFKKKLIKVSTSQTQTEMTYQELVERESKVQLLEQQQDLIKFNERAETESRERTLLRRERDLDLRERLTEEKRLEYNFKQKELNQRLKSQITWPLVCLENEGKLGEKLREIKTTPDLFKGLNLEKDAHFAQFMSKVENRNFIGVLKGELHMKAEGLLKFEYCVLQERARNEIVKSYVESELSALEQEKLELMKEREKYSSLLELERQISDEKRALDSHRLEIQSLIDSMRKNISLIQSPIPPIMKPHQMEIGGGTYGSPHSRNLSYGGLLDNANMSVFDSAMQKTSNLIQSNFSPSKNFMLKGETSTTNPLTKQSLSIYQRVEQALRSHEFLASASSVDPASRSQKIEQLQENLEQMKRILMRQAYFLEQEKKWISEQLQSMKDSKGSTTSEKINQMQMIPEDLDEEKRQIIVQKQQLRGELEQQQKLRLALQDEILKSKEQSSKLVDLEMKMNEQKLKMLIKFERIKQLEEFYNKYHTDEPVSLEIEVSDEEMQEAIGKLIKKKERQALTQKHKQKIIFDCITRQFKYGLARQLKLGESTSDSSDKACHYLFLLLKANVFVRREESQKIRETLKCLDPESIKKLGLQQQFSREFPKQVDESAWFESFWKDKSKTLQVDQFNNMTGEQLFVHSEYLQKAMENFWKFKARNTLKLMELHMRRRNRLLLAFSFQNYKCQTYKARTENVFRLSRQKNRDHNLEVSPDSDQYVNGGAEGSDGQIFPAFTPKLATLVNFQGENDTRKFEGNESHPSHTYTGISEILITQEQNQLALKKHALLAFFVLKKDVNASVQLKYSGFNKWKSYLRDLEMVFIKTQVRKLLQDVENLKFQEQILRTNFRLQKGELESKISELIAYFMGQSNLQQANGI